MFPSLHAAIRAVLASDPADIVQFVLEPLALPSVLEDVMLYGNHFLKHISYMTRTFAFYMHKQYKQLLVQQCHNTPLNKHVIKYSVTGPDASRSDHHEARGSQYGLWDPPSRGDWLTPHRRPGSTTTRDNTSTIVTVGSLLGGSDFPYLACNVQHGLHQVINPGNTGWVYSHDGVTSTQHSSESNMKVPIGYSDPPLHDHLPDSERVCEGEGSALLASTEELPSIGSLGWCAEGAEFGGGGCDRARGHVGNKVTGSCTALQKLCAEVPVTS